MARITLVVAAMAGLLFAGCSGGTFPRVGGSGPSADSVQTVSDAADALDIHRTLASQSAKDAIGAAVALGAFVRDLSARERALTLIEGSGAARSAGTCGGDTLSPAREVGFTTQRLAYYYDSHCRSLALQVVRTSLSTGLGSATALETSTSFAPGRSAPIAVRSDTSQLWRAPAGRSAQSDRAFALSTSGQLSTSAGNRFLSGSAIVVRPTLPNLSAFCLSSAGYGVAGIPSLDETFGWEEGTLSNGARTTDGRGTTRWFATADGDVVRGPIGALTLSGGVVSPRCPMAAQAFSLSGAVARDSFMIPISATFSYGRLLGVSVYDAKFSDGEHLHVSTLDVHGSPSIAGVVERSGTQLATFRVDAYGNGTLAITSTGAQYVMTDWLVVGT